MIMIKMADLLAQLTALYFFIAALFEDPSMPGDI
jgi:hypothetical protein